MEYSIERVIFLLLLVIQISNVAPEEESCVDIDGKLVEHGLYFVPGPNVCTQCVCHHAEPKWCQTMFCNGPPYMCLNYKVGKTCCQFECLDPPTEKPLVMVRGSSARSFPLSGLLFLMLLLGLLRLV